MTLKCTMILGDCLEVMPTLEDKSTKLLLCDPPYGCSSMAWDTPLGDDFIDRLYCHFATSDPVLIAFGSENLLFQWRQKCKTIYRYGLVWEKIRGANFYAAQHRPLVAHEFVSVWGRGRVYNPQMRTGFAPNDRTEGTVRCDFYKKPLRPKGTVVRSGDTRYPISVLKFDKDRAHRRRGKNVNLPKAHSSQKPIALLNWLIRTYSNEGENVLDPTSGSGTTAVAALSCGRNVTCIEKDPGYFEASVERVRKNIRDNFIRAEVEVVR